VAVGAPALEDASGGREVTVLKGKRGENGE
jgi:hypothetical protein